MHHASTPRPVPAPAQPLGDKCTLHDGTWPLAELVARLRSEPRRPAPTGPIARPRRTGPHIALCELDAPSRPLDGPAAPRPPRDALAAVPRSHRPRRGQRPAVELQLSAAGPPAQLAGSAPSRRPQRKQVDQRIVPGSLRPLPAELSDRQRGKTAGKKQAARRRAGMRRKAEELARRGHPREALALMHRALALKPNDGPGLAYCAWLLFQDSPEAADESLRLLARADETDASSADVHYFRGMVLKGLGQVGEAMVCFERALDRDPDDLRAAREIRLHELRGAGSPEAGGLLGWLKRR